MKQKSDNILEERNAEKITKVQQDDERRLKRKKYCKDKQLNVLG